MELTDILSLTVVGVALSTTINLVKEKFKTSTNGSKAITVLLSLAVGGAYAWLKKADLLESTVSVLASASTVYALLLKKSDEEVVAE